MAKKYNPGKDFWEEKREPQPGDHGWNDHGKSTHGLSPEERHALGHPSRDFSQALSGQSKSSNPIGLYFLSTIVALGSLFWGGHHFWTTLPKPSSPDSFPPGSSEYNNALAKTEFYKYCRQIYDHADDSDVLKYISKLHETQLEDLLKYAKAEHDSLPFYRFHAINMWEEISGTIKSHLSQLQLQHRIEHLNDDRQNTMKKEVISPPKPLGSGTVSRDDIVNWNYEAHHGKGLIPEKMLIDTCTWLLSNKDNTCTLTYYFSKLTDDNISQLYQFAIEQERSANQHNWDLNSFYWCDIGNVIKEYGKDRLPQMAPKEDDLKDGFINKWSDRIQIKTKAFLDKF
jgi:hypothetical protein